MRTVLIRIALISIVASLALAGAGAQKTDPLEVQLKAAIQKETVDGDLKAAITQFQRIINTRGVNRSVAAQAMLHLGICYAKQGDAEARKTFEQLIKDYADQPDVLAQARERLEALPNIPAPPANNMSLRPINIDMPTVGDVSSSGRHVVGTYDRGTYSDIWTLDLSTNSKRKITDYAGKGDVLVDPMWMKWAPDETMIAYVWLSTDLSDRNAELRVIDATGSNEKTLYVSKGGRIFVIGWFPDSKAVVAKIFGNANNPGQLVRFSVLDGQISNIQSAIDFWDLYSLSSDGKYIGRMRREKDKTCTISILPSVGGKESEILREKNGMEMVGWDPQGQSLLFISDRGGSRDLWRIPAFGEAQQDRLELVKSNIGFMDTMGTARAGAIFFVSYRQSQNIHAAEVDWAGGRFAAAPRRINSRHIGASDSPVWSPDGTKLAYLAAKSPDERANRDFLCIWSPRDNSAAEFHLAIPISTGYPGISWSSDSKFIFARTWERPWRILKISAETGEIGPPVSIINGSLVAVSGDGQTIFGLSSDRESQSVFADNIAAGSSKELFLWNKPSNADNILLGINGPLSPDGKLLAMKTRVRVGQTPAKYEEKLLLIPTQGGAVREILPANGQLGSPVLWSPDGKKILNFIRGPQDSPADTIWEINVADGTSRKLAFFPSMRLMSATLNPDGKNIAFVASGANESNYWVLENIPPLKTGK